MEDWTGPGPESLYIYHNDGSGSFTEAESIVIDDRLTGTAIGDFDCDGESDIMVGTLRGKIYFLAGDGNGSFATPSVVFDDAGVVYGLDAADLDNDGRLDLAWSDTLNKEVKLAYQQ